jgi:hypothetical protein
MFNAERMDLYRFRFCNTGLPAQSTANTMIGVYYGFLRDKDQGIWDRAGPSTGSAFGASIRQALIDVDLRHGQSWIFCIRVNFVIIDAGR